MLALGEIAMLKKLEGRQIAFAGLAIAAWTGMAYAQTSPEGINKIDNVVVIYLENRSFDHLFGNFPGANGLANAGNAAIQTDENDKPYATLPPALDLRTKEKAPYAAIPI